MRAHGAHYLILFLYKKYVNLKKRKHSGRNIYSTLNVKLVAQVTTALNFK